MHTIKLPNTINSHSFKSHKFKRPRLHTLAGITACSVALLMLTEFVVKMSAGIRPSLSKSNELVDFVSSTSTHTLIAITIDTFLMASLIVFFACLRQIIERAKPDIGWITGIAYGAGLVFVAVTLVGDAMDGGAALDTIGMAGNASVIRALTEGHMLMFGTIGCILTGLLCVCFGYSLSVSQVAPKWIATMAYTVASLNILAVITTFNGTEATSIFSAGGTGVTLLATFPFLVWVIVVGVVMTQKQKVSVPIV